MPKLLPYLLRVGQIFEPITVEVLFGRLRHLVSNISGESAAEEVKFESSVPVSSIKSIVLMNKLLDLWCKPGMSPFTKLKSLDGSVLIHSTTKIVFQTAHRFVN